MRASLRDLVVALAIHVLAMPVWFVTAFVWNPVPAGSLVSAESAARTEAVIAVLAIAVVVVYLAGFVALVRWWKQGRARLWPVPLLWMTTAALPCLLPLLLIPGVRREFVPRAPAETARS